MASDSPERARRAYAPAGPVGVDRATLARFRAGDARAFEAVVREFDPLVRKTVGRYWRSPFEREEAMQEVWVHAFRNRGALDPGRLEAFPGWLAVLARRRCLDLVRAPAPPFASAEEEERAALEELEAPEGPEQAAEARELERAVAAFREGLRPGWREFFELHFVQGLEYEEVAGRLRISRLRCKYMRKVLALQARRDAGLRAALGRRARGGGHAP